MANDFNTVKRNAGIVAKAAAQILSDNLKFCKNIAKADASDYNGKNGYSSGDTIYISKPARFIAGNDFDITSAIQDINEEQVALPLDILSTIGVDVDSQELASEIQMKSMVKRVIEPAVSAIAHDVENQMITKAVDSVYNATGTPGSNTYTIADILAGRTKLGENLAPMNNRNLLLDASASAQAVDARKGLFQSADKIKGQYEDGLIGRADGFDWYETQILPTHTNGNDVTGVAVNDASVATGATTLAVDGLTTTTGTITKGSVFTIAGVFMVHPITKAITSKLQQFVATTDVTANGSGEATVGISPAIYGPTSNGLQNVSALPADDAALTFVGAADGSYLQSLGFQRDAFKMASVPLVMPTNAEFAEQRTVDGITVAIIRDFDVKTRKMITRLDFLGAITAVRPEHANRYYS